MFFLLLNVYAFLQGLDRTTLFCEELLQKHQNETSEVLRFSSTPWNPSFVITWQDCKLMQSKLGLREELRDRYDNDPTVVQQPEVPTNKLIHC